MTIRVGLIGLSYGARMHIPAFKAHPRYELAAVCARAPGRAEAVAAENHVPRFYTDARELIAAPDIDLVSLATPPGTHARFAAAALAERKHVLSEVAFVGSAPDAAILATMARERDRLGAVAFALRYVPLLRHVSDLIVQGAIGQPRLMRLEYFSSFLGLSPAPWPWFWDAEAGGGLLAGFVAHTLDLALRWFGPVRAVTADLAALAGARAAPAGRLCADDSGLLTLHFDSGVLAAFNYSASVAVERTAIEVHGSEASLLIDGFGDSVALLKLGGTTPRPLYPPARYIEATRGVAGLAGGFDPFLDQLALALATGVPPPELPTFADGLAVCRIVDAARLAASERRVVPLGEVP
jgi:predicted dehydrogenase